MMNIVILDGYASNPGDLNWDLLEQLGNVTVYPRTTDEEKIERAKDADIILINKVQIDSETLDQLPKLKYIGIQATGYNVVDIEAAKRHGVVVTNIPAYSTDSVAQMTFALILAITNRVEHYTLENRNERWAYNKDFCYFPAVFPQSDDCISLCFHPYGNSVLRRHDTSKQMRCRHLGTSSP